MILEVTVIFVVITEALLMWSLNRVRKTRGPTDSSWYSRNVCSASRAVLYHALAGTAVWCGCVVWPVVFMPQYGLSFLLGVLWLLPIAAVGGALDGWDFARRRE